MQQALSQDFSRVLSSMCTVPHPVAREAAEQFLADNPGDPGTYDAVAGLERDAVNGLGRVAGIDDPAGYITSGGTEANVQAVRIARNRAETRDPNVVAPASAHFSVRKAAELLDVELRTAPLDDYRVNLDAVAELVDDETALVLGVAGTTEYGRVDPIPALSDLAADAGALCHVDAAWGGFLLPFTSQDWNFSHASIDTMTIDPHKMGRAVVPAGGLLARGPELLDELAIGTPYLESHSQVTLTGTRSGAGVASAAAVIDRMWPDGYRDQYRRAGPNADWLARELAERGFDVVDPTLPIVAADLGNLVGELREEDGWRISRTEAGEARVVCMPHVDRPMLREFVADVDRRRD